VNALRRTIDDVLACPRCHAAFRRVDTKLECTSDACGFRAEMRDGIVCALDSEAGPSFFDAHFPVMTHGSDQPGPQAAFYEQQGAALGRLLAGARVVLDIGCGPRLPYTRPAGALVLGLDRSYESLRQNSDVDVRLYASAARLPVASRSVDAIVCLYSVHHLVGDTVAENERLVRSAFSEFGRVLGHKGQLVVFEVAPLWPVDRIQRLVWNTVRRGLGKTYDMFFWGRSRLERLAREQFPPGTAAEYKAFRVPPLTAFPPAFALQRLKIPRALYPFHICMYTWRVP
jgi:SAM-dependent methyltransferase